MFRQVDLFIALLLLFVFQTNVVSAGKLRTNLTSVGKELALLGEQLNNPLLRVVGLTMIGDRGSRDQLCLLQPCQDWSQWSRCSLMVGNVGIRTRSRECGGKTILCRPNGGTVRHEEDKGLCPQQPCIDWYNWSDWSHCSFRIHNRTRKCMHEDRVPNEVTESTRCNCPPSYNITEGGFCLKLYKEERVTHTTACKMCLNDGSVIVNINTPAKYEAIQRNFKTDFWADGSRTSNLGPWKFEHGERPENMYWQSTRYRHKTNGLRCSSFYESFGRWGRYVSSCDEFSYTLCEYIQ